MRITAVEFDEQDCLDVMTNAIESGYSEWMNDNGPVDVWRKEGEGDIEKLEFQQIGITGSPQTYTVNVEVIHKGLNKILEPGFKVRKDIVASILRDDRDAEVDDCIIQAGLFGELVYG